MNVFSKGEIFIFFFSKKEESIYIYTHIYKKTKYRNTPGKALVNVQVDDNCVFKTILLLLLSVNTSE